MIYIYELEVKSYRPFSRIWIAGIIEKDGEEYLILYSAPWTKRKTLKKIAPGSIKSFRFMGDETPIDGEDVEKKGKAMVEVCPSFKGRLLPQRSTSFGIRKATHRKSSVKTR